MYRLAAAMIVLVACESSRMPVTRRVAVLGYAHPPVSAVIARGERDLVDPWAASLRSAATTTVVVELPQTPSPLPINPREMCEAARAAVPADTALDEIVVIDSYFWPVEDDKCIDEKCNSGPLFAKNDPVVRDCTCIKSRYRGMTVHVDSTVTTLRAAGCRSVHQDKLPTLTAASSPREPIEYELAGDAAEYHAAKSYDLEEARTMVAAAIARRAPAQRWALWQRTSPILSVKRPEVIIGTDPKAKLESGTSYWIKTGARGDLQPGVRAIRADDVTATLALDPKLADPEPGDELHVTVDTRKQSLYGAFGGGIVRAQSATHGSASAALAFRLAFDKLPLMADFQLGGELIPGLDARRGGFTAAGGFRWPRGPISPVVFGELGIAAAYQDFGGPRAVGGILGFGAGVELWLAHWFVFADVRRRYFVMDEWKDRNGNAVDAPYPDLTWISMTGQIGMGRSF